MWNQVGIPLAVAVITLVVEYWIIQPLKSLTKREQAFGLVAIAMLPVAALILIVLLVRTLQSQTALTPITPDVLAADYPFLDAFTLMILLYVAGVLAFALYRWRLPLFVKIKVQRDIEAHEWHERLIKSDTTEGRSARIDQARMEFLVRRARGPNAPVITPDQLAEHRRRLNNTDLRLAALLAALLSSSLLLPLFVVWLKTFFVMESTTDILLLFTIGWLVFTLSYLHFYGQQNKGCFGHVHNLLAFFESSATIKAVLVTGLLLTPILLFAYRAAAEMGWGWKLPLAALASAFLAVPVSWLALLGGSYLASLLIVYLLTPRRYRA